MKLSRIYLALATSLIASNVFANIGLRLPN